MKLPLIIVADRGELKAYEVEETPGMKSVPRLVEQYRIEEARGRYQDKLTDQAGGFPVAGSGGQANGIAERMTLEAEYEMRCFRQVAGHIKEILAKRQPPRWGFAAPSEINGAILDGLPETAKATLKVNVARDLIHIPAVQILGHFR